MLGIELICSDENCAEVKEAAVFSLEELNALICDSCGCTLETLNVWEIVEMRVHRRSDDLPKAA